MPESSMNQGSSSRAISSNPVQTADEYAVPQAGPLPSKRGEIGFVEGVHTPTTRQFQESSESVVLPARHPADRDHTSTEPTLSTDVEARDLAPSTPAINNPHPSSDSITKSKRLFGFLRPKTNTKCGGVRLVTIIFFVLQLSVFTGSIVGWVFATKLLNTVSSSGGRMPAGSSSVFIHVVFGVATLTQLVFLERRLYRLRGERYTYLHPGEVLPRFRTNSPAVDSGTIAFAPWNRPPLPTYAAALAQSGVGTGDVEDNLIAAPPPPAYGNTRGSTLLLASHLSAAMRAERPLSQHTQPDSRPASYVSSEETWQVDHGVERSVRLEATLNTLESNPSSAAVP